MLATLEVPFDEDAAAFAVDAAVECGQPLIVVNVVEIPLGPLCLFMGYGALDATGDKIGGAFIDRCEVKHLFMRVRLPAAERQRASCLLSIFETMKRFGDGALLPEFVDLPA